MKILILGHNGMLGNAVHKYFESKYEIEIHNKWRWDHDNYKDFINNSSSDYIINCIGAIPQKKYNRKEYELLNVELPKFLEDTNKRIIYPSTDCEFSGNLKYPKKYKRSDLRDAVDDYGVSKSKISKIIENDFKNTKIVRTSIIGHEINSSFSLLDWFLNSKGEVNGFINHYWNGVTTLFWAQFLERVLLNWYEYDNLIQIATKGLNKFEILNLCKKIYNKNINVNEFKTEKPMNKMLESDIILPTLEEQLIELKKFYNK